jgi:hypothetical protein
MNIRLLRLRAGSSQSKDEGGLYIVVLISLSFVDPSFCKGKQIMEGDLVPIVFTLTFTKCRHTTPVSYICDFHFHTETIERDYHIEGKYHWQLMSLGIAECSKMQLLEGDSKIGVSDIIPKVCYVG